MHGRVIRVSYPVGYIRDNPDVILRRQAVVSWPAIANQMVDLHAWYDDPAVWLYLCLIAMHSGRRAAILSPLYTETRRQTREPRLNRPPLEPIVANNPFDLLCVDLLKLPTTMNCHKYLLVCVDHFSKYAIAEPLRTKSAEEVARAILDRVVLIHGAPKKIHSDKGKSS